MSDTVKIHDFCKFCRLGSIENYPCQFGGNPETCEHVFSFPREIAPYEVEEEGDIFDENCRLVKKNNELIKRAEKAEAELQQAKKMLFTSLQYKCNPYEGSNFRCRFCNELRMIHKSDCEYEKMIGGVEE